MPTGKVQGDPINYQPGEYISSDLVTVDERSIDQEKYILVIVDEFSGYTWSHLLRYKSESAGIIQGHIAYLNNQNKDTVKQLKTDGGGEFIYDELEDWVRSKGILFVHGPAYTPEYNTKNERSHQTLMGMTRAMLQSSNLENK